MVDWKNSHLCFTYNYTQPLMTLEKSKMYYTHTNKRQPLKYIQGRIRGTFSNNTHRDMHVHTSYRITDFLSSSIRFMHSQDLRIRISRIFRYSSVLIYAHPQQDPYKPHKFCRACQSSKKETTDFLCHPGFSFNYKTTHYIQVSYHNYRIQHPTTSRIYVRTQF